MINSVCCFFFVENFVVEFVFNKCVCFGDDDDCDDCDVFELVIF